MIEHLIEAGHPKNAILEEYTIDQVWLFYDKSLVIRRKKQYEDTLAFAHCMGLPLGGKEAAQSLNKFLNSLLPESFRKATHRAARKPSRSRDSGQELVDALRQSNIQIPTSTTKQASSRKRNFEIGEDGRPIKPESSKRMIPDFWSQKTNK